MCCSFYFHYIVLTSVLMYVQKTKGLAKAYIFWRIIFSLLNIEGIHYKLSTALNNVPTSLSVTN